MKLKKSIRKQNFEVESLVLFMRKQSKILMTKMFSWIYISSSEMAISFNMNNLPGQQSDPKTFKQNKDIYYNIATTVPKYYKTKFCNS